MSIKERIDNVTRIDPEYLATECPPPKSVKVELTNKCNYLCQFCSLRTRETPGNQCMSKENFALVVDQAAAAGVEEISPFFLGESMTNPRLLVWAIEYAKSKIPYVFLTTNGSLARPHVVEACMKAGLDSLKFSINAADDEQFEGIMGVKAKNYHRALENLKAARRIRDAGGYKTHIAASYIAYDGEHRANMQKLLDEHVRPYADEVYALPLYGMSLRADEIEAATGYRPTHGNMGRLDEETGIPTRPGLPCWSLFTEAHVRIGEDGHPEMAACCFGADNRFDVGNIAKLGFMGAWNSEPMRKMREAQIRTKTEGPDALRGTPCEVCVAY